MVGRNLAIDQDIVNMVKGDDDLVTHLVADGGNKPLCGSSQGRKFYLGTAEDLGQALPPDACRLAGIGKPAVRASAI